jgi:predicted small secreted protein
VIRTLTLLVLAAWLGVLVGCNTMHGVGKDVEAAGKGIQKSTK